MTQEVGKPAEPEIIPASQGGSTTQAMFRNIIDAISQIQQFAVMESANQEIPKDFLTLRGALNFFNIGFGNGFIEGLLFALLTALILPVMADHDLNLKVAKVFPLVESKLFLWMLNCLPIIIAVCICCFLSQYRMGNISKRAVDNLLIGRLCCLLVKGIIIFVLLIMLSKAINPDNAWDFAVTLSFKDEIKAMNLYRIICNTQPRLVATAYHTLFIFFVAMMTPFFSVWLISIYRNFRERQNKLFWESD